MKTPWKEFWDGLSEEEKVLFRLLQRVHRELGKNVQMFSTNWMMPKKEIEDYVQDKFGVNLNNLPKDQQ